MPSREDDIARMRALKPGDPVTNICAGEENPHRHAMFVAYEVTGRRNKYGVIHRTHYALCVDPNGKTSRTAIEVIYPGHLDMPTCESLFSPIWEARYGAKMREDGATQAGDIPDFGHPFGPPPP